MFMKFGNRLWYRPTGENHRIVKKIHSWPLNNTGLNSTSPVIHGFFSIVNTAVLHNPRLVESMEAGLQTRTANCKVILRFSTVRRVSTPNPRVVQGSIVYRNSLYYLCNISINLNSFQNKRLFEKITTDGAGTTGSPHAKEWSCIPTSHHIQKLTQSGSQTYY